MMQVLAVSTPTLAQAVEFGIGAWIHETFGHTNAATTGLYLETITRNQNQFIGKLTTALGLSGMMAKLFAPSGGVQGGNDEAN